MKVSYMPLLAVLLLVCSGAVKSESLWLNTWDESCYSDGVNNCRDDWYKTEQGSHLIKWEVFQTIERAGSEVLFSSSESLAQYGFASADSSYSNSGNQESDYALEGLPFGFLKDKSRLNNRNYLGLSCSACHTGEFVYGDDRYLVEGGQTNANTPQFLLDMVSALQETLNDPAKLSRFKSRFFWYVVRNRDFQAWPVAASAGKAYLKSAEEYLSGFTGRNNYVVESGPGRLDAIGSILNELHVHQAGKDDEAAVDLTAPVSYPFLWGVSELECVQTNCVSNNPIERNIGEVLGVFGSVNIDEDENVPDLIELAFRAITPLFDYTPKVDNLNVIETALSKLNSPKWPNSFPPLDPQLVNNGRALYADNCSACHIDTSDGVDDSELTQANSIGRRYTKVTRVLPEDVGTDEAFSADYGLREETTGILGSVLANAAPDSVDPNTGIPFGEQVPENFNALALLGISTQVVTNAHYETLGFKAKARSAYPDLPVDDAIEALIIDYSAGQVDRPELSVTSYRARPLDGVAFTGPYLHNGSVRTLRDLLKAPSDRPNGFYVGAREYDVDGAGFVDGGDFYVDATLRGNRKEGHYYGTALSQIDKEALLEYLKSL